MTSRLSTGAEKRLLICRKLRPRPVRRSTAPLHSLLCPSELQRRVGDRYRPQLAAIVRLRSSCRSSEVLWSEGRQMRCTVMLSTPARAPRGQPLGREEYPRPDRRKDRHQRTAGAVGAGELCGVRAGGLEAVCATHVEHMLHFLPDFRSEKCLDPRTAGGWARMSAQGILIADKFYQPAPISEVKLCCLPQYPCGPLFALQSDSRSDCVIS
jgi:hypothetical protein